MEGAADGLDVRARAFLGAAWRVLGDQRVVPPSVFHPYLAVGTDYFGPYLDRLPEYRELASAIEATHPRFSREVPLMERAFAGPYIFSFLQSCIAGLALDREEFSLTAAAVGRSIASLETAAVTAVRDVAVCRVITHLTTKNGKPLEVAGVTVEPLPPGSGSADLPNMIAQTIPAAQGAFGRDMPVIFSPPESLVVAQSQGVKPFDEGEIASRRIDQFLLSLRLLHAGTSDSAFEVRGEMSLVREYEPTLLHFRGNHTPLASTQMLRRETSLGSRDNARFEGLSSLIQAAEDNQPDMVFTSFGMAMKKFVLSYHAHVWYEQVVDLTTALEASLSGSATSDVTLRLCNRAAVLLATKNDPAAAIFNDIKVLYGLRSTLVHGGSVTNKALRKKVYALSTVPADAMYGVALGYLVDRLRDLVRRSLLVRICLAGGEKPRWALGTDDGVDADLADDAVRRMWRKQWRDTLASIGARDAADRPRHAVDWLTPYGGS